jgi:hypothetical protein
VASVQPIGWSATAAPGPTAASYAGQLEELAAELVLWRRQEPPTGPGTRARNLAGRRLRLRPRIRVAKATLFDAPILCSSCAPPFDPEEPAD